MATPYYLFLLFSQPGVYLNYRLDAQHRGLTTLSTKNNMRVI
jgi:hypothetical protein